MLESYSLTRLFKLGISAGGSHYNGDVYSQISLDHAV